MTYTVKFSNGTEKELKDIKNIEEAEQKAYALTLDEPALAGTTFIIKKHNDEEKRKEEEKKQEDTKAYDEQTRSFKHKSHVR